MVLCIIPLLGAAAVPDVQGPLTLSQCNLAGNARTLLTLLLFPPTHCIVLTHLTASDFIYLLNEKTSPGVQQSPSAHVAASSVTVATFV